jgi:hypothetical protein
MSDTEFVMREIDLWGEDKILALLDRGYTPILVRDNRTGNTKWTWQLPPNKGLSWQRGRNTSSVSGGR